MSKKGNSVFEDILNVALQGATFGTLGVSEEGVGLGVVGEAGASALKDITGVTAAEDANKIAREQFETEQAAIETERETAQADSAQAQLKASRLAGTARKTSTRTSTGRSAQGSQLIGDERDFLGL
ncbi:hypothetical protein KAT92_05460 [Candidatus Babeliales bacterium]|nr:hypothetical protein [Candidatus Babeliales bacterium]